MSNAQHNSEDVLLLTEEGLKQLQEELVYLKETRRQEVASRLKDAISYGDLSENSEYQEAKEEQAFLEGKILDTEKKIKMAKVVDSKKTGIVRVGSKVQVEVEGKKKEYTIVGSTEVDPFAGKISNESPLGFALIGRKKGETVNIEAPSGIIPYTVVSVD